MCGKDYKREYNIPKFLWVRWFLSSAGWCVALILSVKPNFPRVEMV